MILRQCCTPETHLCSSAGIPFPIIVAWAIGKLYYDNEK